MLKLDIRCLISGDQTDGRVAVFEEIVEPGSGPPLHVHRTQLEIFHILEGKFRFHLDGTDQEFGAGDTVLVPAGAKHAFKNLGDTPAKIHFELLPAGKSEESFVKLVNEVEKIEDLAAFFEEYDMELAGPPLE